MSNEYFLLFFLYDNDFWWKNRFICFHHCCIVVVVRFFWFYAAFTFLNRTNQTKSDIIESKWLAVCVASVRSNWISHASPKQHFNRTPFGWLIFNSKFLFSSFQSFSFFSLTLFVFSVQVFFFCFCFGFLI